MNIAIVESSSQGVILWGWYCDNNYSHIWYNCFLVLHVPIVSSIFVSLYLSIHPIHLPLLLCFLVFCPSISSSVALFFSWIHSSIHPTMFCAVLLSTRFMYPLLPNSFRLLLTGIILACLKLLKQSSLQTNVILSLFKIWLSRSRLFSEGQRRIGC